MLAMYLCIEMSHTGIKKKIKTLKIRPNTVLTNIWFASSQTLIQNHTWCTNNTVILLGSIALFLTCMLRNQLSQFENWMNIYCWGSMMRFGSQRNRQKLSDPHLSDLIVDLKTLSLLSVNLTFFSMQENIFKKWQKPMHSYLN